MRNAATADTSATHNHRKEKIKLQNKNKTFLRIKNNLKCIVIKINIVGW
jgi:hypothetical protein